MTPDEIGQVVRGVTAQLTAHLSPQINDTNKKVDDIIEKLATLAARQEAHDELHAVHSATRGQTCPSAPAVRKVAADVDAIAGIQRTQAEILADHEKRLAEMEKAASAEERAEAVDAAVAKVRMAPLAWLAKNTDKVFWACLTAIAVTLAVAEFIEKR